MYIAGEPLQPDIEDWYFKVVGREKCLLIDAWGQTGEDIIYIVSLMGMILHNI